jgi:hypothetical protein
MKNAIIWDVKQSGSCKNRRSGGIYRFHFQSGKNRRTKSDVSSKYSQCAPDTSYCYRSSQLADLCHFYDGGDIFFGDIGSYKSHTT